MENDVMLPEEENSILTLTDDEGNAFDFEYLDCIEYEGKEYLVLLPTEDEDGNVFILEVEPVDEETESYTPVEDDDVANAVYAIFKEKFKDILTFGD